MCYHKKHLMGYFGFLHGSRTIYLFLNISENCIDNFSLKSWKRQRLINLKNNIYHSNKRGSPTFFHSDTSTVLCHFLVYFVDKTHVLVVTLELILLFFLIRLPLSLAQTSLLGLRDSGEAMQIVLL